MVPEPKKAAIALDDPVRHSGFYEDRADEYFEETRHTDMKELYQWFLSGLPHGGLILDAGSGSGRDTLEFIARGYQVEAFDASAALAALSSRYTGVQTEVLAFENFVVRPNRYDGIWAMASLLHVRRRDLPRVIAALAASLKPGGIFLATFKSGANDLIDEFGRSFTNLSLEGAERLFRATKKFGHVEAREVAGTASFGRQTVWIHVLAKRG